MEERYQTFTRLIAKCSRGIQRIKNWGMAEFSLKSSHVSCLYYLYANGNPMTAKELCDACGEDKAHVSRSIDKLETDGYVVCQSKTKKRYNSPISLTERGVEIAEKIVQKVDGVLEKSSEGLSEENRRIFYESLWVIANNLDKIYKEYND